MARSTRKFIKNETKNHTWVKEVFIRCAIKLERSHIILVDEKKQNATTELNDHTKHYYLAC